MIERIELFFANVQRNVLKYKLYHLLFWGVYVLAGALFLPVSGNVAITILKQLPIFVLHATVVYINFQVLIPRFLLVRNYLAYVISVVLLVF